MEIQMEDITLIPKEEEKKEVPKKELIIKDNEREQETQFWKIIAYTTSITTAVLFVTLLSLIAAGEISYGRS
jgi:hypothetical protein